MNILKIWPRIESAVGLKHPHGPTMAADGAHWQEDGFTARLITEGSVTRDEDEALKPSVSEEPAKQTDPIADPQPMPAAVEDEPAHDAD